MPLTLNYLQVRVSSLHRRVRRRELRRRQRRRFGNGRRWSGRNGPSVLARVAVVPAKRRRRPERERRRESGNVSGLNRRLAGAVVRRVDGGIRARVLAAQLVGVEEVPTGQLRAGRRGQGQGGPQGRAGHLVFGERGQTGRRLERQDRRVGSDRRQRRRRRRRRRYR